MASAKGKNCLLELRLGQEMIVLHHDTVVETHPMVLPSAGLDRSLFQGAQTRRRLSCVENLDSRATHSLHELSGQGGDTRKALNEVQSNAFAGENRASQSG